MFTHKRFFLSNMKQALLELALGQSFVDLVSYWIKTPRFSINILMASLVTLKSLLGNDVLKVT